MSQRAEPGLGARRLIATDALVRRRTQGWRTHPAVLALGAGVLGSVLLWWAGGDAALGWWRLVAAFAPAWIVMAGPWRLFWTHDARILARLPVRGQGMFDRGTLASARHAALSMAALALAGVPVFVALPAAETARLLLVLAAAHVVAACLGPVTALAGGAMATSTRTTRAIGEVTGAGTGPQMVWVSLLPALGAGCVIFLSLGMNTFAPDVASTGVAVVAAVFAGGLFLLAARRASERFLGGAVRDLSAADRVRLAHVDLDGARGLEALWGKLAGDPGRAVYTKDVALARRRYPAYYLLGLLGTLIAWGVALFGSPDTRLRWTLGIVLFLCGYALLMAGRLVRPPIEHPRLLATWPWPASAVTRAKSLHVLWRIVLPVALAGLPATFRAATPAVWLVWGAALCAATFAASLVRLKAAR